MPIPRLTFGRLEMDNVVWGNFADYIEDLVDWFAIYWIE